VEVIEEGGVPEGAVETPLLELGDGQEQIREAGALGPEEVGVVVEDSSGLEEFGFVHEPTLSRDFQPSWNERGSPPSHSPP